MAKLNVDEILLRNPQLNLEHVAKMEAFCRAAEQAGISLAPEYRVEPPLGELVPQSSQRLLVRQKT